MKKYIYIGAGIVVVAIVGYFIYQSKQVHYSLATVTRGSMTQQVLANGSVEAPTTIELSFQSAGKLVALNAHTGEAVHAGQVLARQDSSVLAAQMQQAQANVAAQTAKLSQLEAGATPQSIAVSRAALASAQQALTNAYAGVPSILNDAYSKANDAVRTQLAPFFTTPEGKNPQLTFAVTDSQVANGMQSARSAATDALNAWQAELASVTAGAKAPALDAALSSSLQHLSIIQNLMNLSLTALVDETGLSASTLATYKASATAGANETNAAVAEASGAQQSIAAEQAAVSQAQAALDLTTASSTSQDVQAQQAQVQQAQANVAAIQAQIAQTVLTAPADGTVTITDGTAIGENMVPNATIASILPNEALEVKLNVSEDNVVGVKTGQPAIITLDAFPSTQTWQGSVVSIDPAQTVMSGAVYYQTTVLFGAPDPRVKAGMSATVYIQTGYATSTLMVPASTLKANGASASVETYQDGKAVPRAVTTGLKGQDGMVEITSGLSEGEQVITGE